MADKFEHMISRRQFITTAAALPVAAALCRPALAFADDDLVADSGAGLSEEDGSTQLSDAASGGGTREMYRVYNPNSGEHFYTASTKERENLVKAGWAYEGVGWIAPGSSSTPVYRLYSGTDHHYTTSKKEMEGLKAKGWKDEGIGWYSDDSKRVPLYRQFNPNVKPSAKRNNSGSHNYTTSKSENDKLVKAGWKAEGVGWYGVKAGYNYFTYFTGWYQSVGTSGMYFRHFTNGFVYFYKRDDLNDIRNKGTFSYEGRYSPIIEKFSVGDYSSPALKNKSGYRIKLGLSYFFRTSDREIDVLDYMKADGTGYSGSGSFFKITDVPANLLKVAKSVEG